jgi:hypothetical protein
MWKRRVLLSACVENERRKHDAMWGIKSVTFEGAEIIGDGERVTREKEM